mgnify:CR=1 FL=1
MPQPAVQGENWSDISFQSATGTDLQGREKDFLRIAPVRGLAKVYLLPDRLSFFEVYRVKDLRKKKMITDAELDMLIEYFKEKKKLLDEAAGKPFQSNGQTYYWISRDLLP